MLEPAPGAVVIELDGVPVRATEKLSCPFATLNVVVLLPVRSIVAVSPDVVELPGAWKVRRISKGPCSV